MTLSLVRMKFAAAAVKIETTPGTDAIAGTPAAADWVAGDCSFEYNPQVIDNPELTGTLDKAPSIVGGLQPKITLRVPLRGSGTAGTAPDFGKLLRCCTMSETITAAALGAPTAATAGTTTTLTLGAPFGTTAQQYRGMPLLLTGDRTGQTGITDYTTGKIATVGHTEATAMTVSTLAQIPINVLYSPTSDESVYKTATLYFYADGLQWTFTGCQGTWSLELTAGGLGFFTIVLEGQFASHAAAAMPTGWNTALRQTPPRWVAGRAQFNRLLARCRRLMIDFGVTAVLPDNPEAAQGYDPAVPIIRDSRGSIDPLMDTASSVALFTAFQAGTSMPVMAIIGATAGNRFIVVAPAAKATGFRPGDRDGLGQYDIGFQLDGADSDVYLAQF